MILENILSPSAILNTDPTHDSLQTNQTSRASGRGEGWGDHKMQKTTNKIIMFSCFYEFSSSGLFGFLLFRKVQNGIWPLPLNEKNGFVWYSFSVSQCCDILTFSTVTLVTVFYKLEPVLLRATLLLLSWELNGLEWQTESQLCKSLIGSIGLAQSYNPRCLVFNLQKADYSCLGGHQICYKERGAQSEGSQSTSCFRVKLIEFQRS